MVVFSRSRPDFKARHFARKATFPFPPELRELKVSSSLESIPTANSMIQRPEYAVVRGVVGWEVRLAGGFAINLRLADKNNHQFLPIGGIFLRQDCGRK
jgi:hypothetical protein